MTIKTISVDVLAARLIARRYIDPVSGCWVWCGAKLVGGYGKVAAGRKGLSLLVHRAAAALWLDFDIDSTLQVLHRCDKPACFNPEHLFVGTQRENIIDCINKGRFNRPQGEDHPHHKFSEATILDIKRLAKKGVPFVEIAQRYSTAGSTISGIVLGRRWKHHQKNSKVQRARYKCLRCSYEWRGCFKNSQGIKIPVGCAKCGSVYWNTPRKSIK
jgi:hypothetical protein